MIAMAARLSTAHTVIKRSLMLKPPQPPDYWWPARVPLDFLRRIVEREAADAAALAVTAFQPGNLNDRLRNPAT